MKQEECDGNDQVSKGVKKMSLERFEVVQVISARESSYLNETQSLSLACCCFCPAPPPLPFFFSLLSDRTFSLHRLERRLQYHESMLIELMSERLESEEVFIVTVGDFLVSNML